MKIKTVLILTVVLVCVIVYSFFAIKKETSAEYAISIDLAKPLAIEWPCEIAIVGGSGEKGFRIAPKVGRGWRGEAGGKASYRFFIPKDGRYYIWAYSLWFDACANAVFAQIDNQDKAIVGNDPVYNRWHWVRGFDVNLKKGTHSLLLSNHSDHISLQRIVLLNSDSASPQQIGLVFSDIFYDGFDGCDEGNFAIWHKICGDWNVRNPESETCFTENSLIGDSVDEAFIIYENNNWESYYLDISVKLLPSDSEEKSIDICFGVNDPNDFYHLCIEPVHDGNTAKISVVKQKSGNSTVLSEFKLPFKVNEWQQVQISLDNGQIEAKLSDSNPVRIETGEKITGGIGLLLQGKVTAYFDNIHVRKSFKKAD